MYVCVGGSDYGFFVIEVFSLFSYCLLQAVKIHIEDHSVSSRVIFNMAGWRMERAGAPGEMGAREGWAVVAAVGGAPLKIPID